MRSGLSYFAEGGLTKELQGSSIRNIPQNKLLGALSRVLQGVDEFTKPARNVPYAGALVPSFGNLSKTLEDASYGMPLTTGKGLAGTLSIKPGVGLGALEAAQLLGLGRVGLGAARGIAKAAPIAMERAMARQPATRWGYQAGAVKPQGGQWLPGSAKEFVERAVDDVPSGREGFPVETWAEKQIPKYIEKYMGARVTLWATA